HSKTLAAREKRFAGSIISGRGLGKGARPLVDTAGGGHLVTRGKALSEAVIKVGLVQGMCSAKEISDRVVQGDVAVLEREHPQYLKPTGQPWSREELMIKKHQRAAAGLDISKAELLRTPLWLAHTMDHIVQECMDRGWMGGGGGDPRLESYLVLNKVTNGRHTIEEQMVHELYDFIWNRTRMVRSDYSMQGFNSIVGLTSDACMLVYERMARWYIIMSNRMSVNGVFRAQHYPRLNLKEQVATLKALMDFYSLRFARDKPTDGSLVSPNEPEV
ncbi:unnamed protein product, partial [Discosporangium mesarthrocarpum]